MANKLELRLLEEEEFEVFLNEVSDFYIVDDTELARDLKIK